MGWPWRLRVTTYRPPTCAPCGAAVEGPPSSWRARSRATPLQPTSKGRCMGRGLFISIDGFAGSRTGLTQGKDYPDNPHRRRGSDTGRRRAHDLHEDAGREGPGATSLKAKSTSTLCAKRRRWTPSSNVPPTVPNGAEPFALGCLFHAAPTSFRGHRSPTRTRAKPLSAHGSRLQGQAIPPLSGARLFTAPGRCRPESLSDSRFSPWLFTCPFGTHLNLPHHSVG